MQTHLYYWGLVEDVRGNSTVISDAYYSCVLVTDELWKDIVVTKGSKVTTIDDFVECAEDTRGFFFKVSLPSGRVKVYKVFDKRFVLKGSALTARYIIKEGEDE